jgi:two-component system invasion response regulator UvrY
MIRILIADDHPIFRQGLKQVLAEAQDMIVADEAGDGHELLAKTRNNEYDIVLLDISMPGASGLDLLKQLKIEKPKLPILILSMHPEEQYAVRVLKAGAAGYLTKASAPDELIGAVRKVLRGGRYITASLAEKLVKYLKYNQDLPMYEILSDREYQVLCMIASGKQVKEIASEMALSVKTISTYRSRILEKLNMKSNAELTHYAIQNQLVD